MSNLNWATFESLPGAQTTNFEMLCRGIVRRHYGQFGEFRALANQPGVEFHLKLSSACDLGAPPRWFGWQCKWYGLNNGEDIGTTRRQQIKESIEKTEKYLPGITDWILCTRHVLTKGDQEWFFKLSTKMTLGLWSDVEVEDRLSGPAAILRETYFGQLVLTPEALNDLHQQAVAPIRNRWMPEVHQVVEAEREIHRTLGEMDAWAILTEISAQLDGEIQYVATNTDRLTEDLKKELVRTLEHARATHGGLCQSIALLEQGQYETLINELPTGAAPTDDEWRLLRRLRSKRHAIGLYASNMLADMKRTQGFLAELQQSLVAGTVAVVADAGCGKTQMSAELTAATTHRSAGLFLRGKNLSAGQTLDDLAHRISIRGKPVESFEALVAAVDAAGQRQGRRLPFVIDGLNEAEDPRDWKDQLASAAVILGDYSNIQVICTLRSAFAQDTLPQGIPTLEITGFDEDRIEAIRRYFAHYRIDAADAELPLELLDHPLTLRIFCDVTNPDRKQTVGVGAIPSSLTVLFDRYLEQVAQRIAELAPASKRIFQTDVREALNKIGLELWRANARSIDIAKLRNLLNDELSTWDQSIVAALEHDGILFREPSETAGQGSMSVLYDALAGHVVAEALLTEYSGNQFDEWVRDSGTAKALTTNFETRSSVIDSATRYIADRLPEDWKWKVWNFRNQFRKSARRDFHPFATDILRALVGLTPHKLNRKQLWPFLHGNLRTDAIVESAYMDGAFLDHQTVSEIAELVRRPAGRCRDLLGRLFVTRAAVAHPLNADFLDSILRPMSIADRDLRWSEWMRRREHAQNDFERLSRRWKNGGLKGKADQLRARWVMWSLTSTNRLLRDHATHALYQYGCFDPRSLFDLAIESLEINDPYVPERVLAACYGVGMSLWADPNGTKVRDTITRFANVLIERMFMPNAPRPTFHALTRGYAIGVITLAKKIDPSCIPSENLAWLKPPYDHLPCPFPPASEIKDSQIAGADNAMHMDFENYTLGRLIHGRSNYDFENSIYKEVRRQIEYRIVSLGYSPSRFKVIDNMIAGDSYHTANRSRGKTDRYGKKYSWIAFFEMYGVKSDRDELDDWREVRPSDTDIDPSFPEPAKTFQPHLADLFASAPKNLRAWMADGPTPDYSGLLQPVAIDGIGGPWVLLEGYIEQSSPTDSRRVFSFLRGIIVKRSSTAKILELYNAIEYPGNRAIPEPLQDYYTFAGEIPWSEQFGAELRDSDGKAKRDEREAFEYHDGKKWVPGIDVEIPAYRFAWESYHSELNKTHGTHVPAPALCERFGLSNRKGEWDYYEPSGRVATLYREFKDSSDTFDSHLLFIRADLLAEYLADECDLLWLVWGERNLHYEDAMSMRSDLQEVFQDHRHIHRFSQKWTR